MSASSNQNFESMGRFENQMRINQTQQLIDGLVLERVRSVRTTRVGVGTFAMVMSILLIGKILLEARKSSQLEVKLRPTKSRVWAILRSVHPADTIFLVLAIALTVQNIIFIAIQSASFQSIEVSGCSKTVQVIFPIAFLSGYIHLVFGLETTIRSFGVTRFAKRSQINIPLCLVGVTTLVIATWLPTALWKIEDRCLGDILFRAVRFSFIGMVVISAETLAFLIMIMVIVVQLKRSVDIEPSQRVAASRMIMRLWWTICVNALILPFFVQGKFMTFDSMMSTSNLADLVLFGNGAFITFEYFVYWLYPSWCVFHTKESARLAAKGFKGGRSARHLDLTKISSPINKPDFVPKQYHYYSGTTEKTWDDKTWDGRATQTLSTFSAPTSKRTVPSGLPASPKPRTSMAAPLLPATVFVPPSEVQDSTHRSSTQKRNKTSYSLFPNNDGPRLPATAYTPASKGKQCLHSIIQSVSSLKRNIPTPLTSPITPLAPKAKDLARLEPLSDEAAANRDTFTSGAPPTPSVIDVNEVAMLMDLEEPSTPFSREHKRLISSGSSATVQIGLRFSVPLEAIAAGNSSASKRVLDNSETASPLRRELSLNKGSEPKDQPSKRDVPSSTHSTHPAQQATTKLTQSSTTPTTNSSQTAIRRYSSYTKPTPTVSIPQLAIHKDLPPTPRAEGLRMNPVTSVAPQGPRGRLVTTESPVQGEIGLALPLGGGADAKAPAPGWI